MTEEHGFVCMKNDLGDFKMVAPNGDSVLLTKFEDT